MPCSPAEGQWKSLESLVSQNEKLVEQSKFNFMLIKTIHAQNL